MIDSPNWWRWGSLGKEDSKHLKMSTANAVPWTKLNQRARNGSDTSRSPYCHCPRKAVWLGTKKVYMVGSGGTVMT